MPNRENAAMLHAVHWGPAHPKRLVVLCHGVGADGQDLIGLAPHWSAALPETGFTAPDAPEPYDGGPTGRQWWSLGDRDPARTAIAIEAARPALDAFIDGELARLALPPDAYALMGFSQGAMMVLYAGLRRRVPPRAILAFSGALIAPDRLAGRVNDAPVLLVHGESDEVVPVQRSREAEAALRDAGIPVDAHYIPALGHGIDEQGLGLAAAMLARWFGL